MCVCVCVCVYLKAHMFFIAADRDALLPEGQLFSESKVNNNR